MSNAKDEPASGLRVLVVDDNAMNRQITRKLLDRFGHQASFANHGREALDLVTGQPPYDVILMDRHMPVMDGLEATRRIRALPGAENATPIIALTGAESRTEVNTCLEAGMNDIVAKPIDPEHLRTTLVNAAAGIFEAQTNLPQTNLPQTNLAQNGDSPAPDSDAPIDAQERFLSKMNHDLRNEINAISGHLFMLRHGAEQEISTHDLANHAAEVSQVGARIQGLGEAIAAMIRLEAGDYTIAPGRLDVRKCVDDCIALVGPLDRPRISTRLPGDLPEIEVDEHALKILLGGLIANALQGSSTAREVEVSAELSDDAVNLSVTEPGAGLSLAEASELQTPWGGAWADGGETTLSRLRYAVAARLMALHQGRLEISPRPGGGSRATATIPRPK